jgi:stage V sporulation protein AB
MITTFIQADTGRDIIMKTLVAMLVAFANGLTVGSGLVAFLAIIGLVPRLAEVTHTEHSLRWYQLVMVLGSTLATLELIYPANFHLPGYMSIIPGIFMGLFVGCLAAALAEVLNVLPVMTRRVGLLIYIRFLLLAMILGKVCGSLLYWLVPGF